MRTWPVFVAATALGALGGGMFARDAAAQLMPDAGGHGAWYASRAAGIASYVFIWLGLAGGFAMSSAWFDGLVGRGRLLAVHQSASIAGILLGLAHGLVLIPDEWTRFTLWDILVPFGSYYEPLLSGIGTLALYLGAVVSASFWFRTQLGVKRWRMLHYASFLVYAGALYHGLNMGTDAEQPWLIGLYLGTSLTVVFWLSVRITYTRTIKRRTAEGVSAA